MRALNIKKVTVLLATAVMALGATTVAADSVSLDQLLQQVRQGRTSDNAENAQRISQFRANRAQQQQLAAQAKKQQQSEEARSKQLELLFEEQDVKVIEMERQLQERLGELKELLGVVQGVSGDARGMFDASMTQVQFPDRSRFMTELARKTGQTSRLPSLDDIERLWFEMQREMTESGKVVKFMAPVITAGGEEVEKEVTRIGVFNAIADGKYLNYTAETGNLGELGRQPQSRFLSKLNDLESASTGVFPVGLDPSRGSLLANLVKAPNLAERIQQGKVVGYVIIGLGIIGVLIALWRLMVLTTVGAKVNSQAKNLSAPGNNPLGRVLKVYQDFPQADVETMELRLGEAILKETPKLNSMLPFLKIISVVAPLLGLLGTVTGMIQTFQAITLYGTGDPKLMAGGISTALVTTVLGLVVAIPMVFLHTMVASRAKSVTEILQQQAAGMVAERAEGGAG